MEWHHQTSRKNKLKDIPSAGKVMTTVFWDAQGVTSVGITPRVQTTTQICTFRISKPRKSTSGEFDCTKMVLKSSFNTTTHNDTQV
jgi:hypothetical protein